MNVPSAGAEFKGNSVIFCDKSLMTSALSWLVKWSYETKGDGSSVNPNFVSYFAYLSFFIFYFKRKEFIALSNGQCYDTIDY